MAKWEVAAVGLTVSQSPNKLLGRLHVMKGWWGRVQFTSNCWLHAARSVVMCPTCTSDQKRRTLANGHDWHCLSDSGWSTYAVAPQCLVLHSMPMPINM
jgi:hypothetical protein